ncbi:CopL family metal-binding regulatory protein [Stenotrophomonas sp. GZD-301]|uniref:CopL family metal-binding regulatory protein n=1 Tax=Stenotrophomonas sp. GZD-301 TaxID=3404814 RepID=UPI003BB72298
MTAGGLLLRLILMLSLLLNGLNAALAGPMALAMAHPVDAAVTAPAPPCHGHDAVAAPPQTAGLDHAQAPHESDPCKIKDCLRTCAQQPSLAVQIAWIATPPPPALAPLPPVRATLPSLPLDRITRPPIA